MVKTLMQVARAGYEGYKKMHNGAELLSAENIAQYQAASMCEWDELDEHEQLYWQEACRCMLAEAAVATMQPAASVLPTISQSVKSDHHN